jgi:hypothetical protein
MTVDDPAALRRMTASQLAEQYAALFGAPTTSRNKSWLTRRILWRRQALTEGGLSDAARHKARELARHADFRQTPPRLPAGTGPEPVVLPLPPADANDPRLPPPGTVLIRAYKGGSVQVQVLAAGFAYEGTVYRTLSAAAKSATGTHVNGYQFFRLDRQGDAA